MHLLFFLSIQVSGWLWRGGSGVCPSLVCPVRVPEVPWAFRPLHTWPMALGTSSLCGKQTHSDSWSFSTGTQAHRTRYGQVHIFFKQSQPKSLLNAAPFSVVWPSLCGGPPRKGRPLRSPLCQKEGRIWGDRRVVRRIRWRGRLYRCCEQEWIQGATDRGRRRARNGKRAENS